MDHTDKVHLQLMTNMNAVDDVLADIEPIGYTLKLVRIPRYVWIYDQEGVGEDANICTLKTDESPRVVEAEWVEYRELIEKQQRSVDYGGTDKTGYLELEDKYGPGIAFTAYLRGKGIDVELIEPEEIPAW
jgi:hypothetical protein